MRSAVSEPPWMVRTDKILRRLREGRAIIHHRFMRLITQDGMNATKNLRCRWSFWLFSLLLIAAHVVAQTPSSEAQGGMIRGIVKSGNMPIPGAAVSISSG